MVDPPPQRDRPPPGHRHADRRRARGARRQAAPAGSSAGSDMLGRALRGGAGRGRARAAQHARRRVGLPDVQMGSPYGAPLRLSLTGSADGLDRVAPRSPPRTCRMIGAALELHRRRQLVAAGQPVALDEREALDRLGPRERARWRRRRPPGRRRSRARRAPARPGRPSMPCGPPRRARRRRRARAARCCSGRPSPITHAWPISGIAPLSVRLDVRRRHVLAGRVDDQLLLAVDDRDVAVLVDRGHVAGVQPAVVVERLGGAVGQVAVADHDDLRADEQLAVLGQLDLDARRRQPDGADLDPLARVRRARAAGLATCPRSRPAGRRWRGRTRAPRAASAPRRR